MSRIFLWISAAACALPATLLGQSVTASQLDPSLDVTSIIQASDGNLWGTAGNVVFKITPDGNPVTVIDFTNLTLPAGMYPISQLVGITEGNDGNFYVVSAAGGAGYAEYAPPCSCGTLFKLTPAGDFTVLYSFPQAEVPVGGLFQAADNTIYGTYGYGLYDVQPDGSNFNTLSSQWANGSSYTPALLATDGHLWGVIPHTANNEGFVYAAQQDFTAGYLPLAYANYNDNIVYNFPLTEGTDGNLYFPSNSVVYQIVPGAAKLATVASSVQSITPLISGTDGNLYGVTGSGLFKFAPGATGITMLPTTGIIGSGSGQDLIQGSDGALYDPAFGLFKYVVSPALPAPVQLTASPTVVAPNQAFTLNWKVLNAVSLEMQNCNAFESDGGTGEGTWSGPQTGTLGITGVMSGSANITPTAPGTYTYALTCGGVESGTATVEVTGTLSNSATSTRLVANAQQNQQVKLTAIVTANSGGRVPTGSVAFKYGSLTLATAPVNAYGIATYSGSTVGLPGGAYNVEAVYSGDTYDAPSTSSSTTATVASPTTTSLTVTPQFTTNSANIVLNVTVKGVPGGHQPTGEVTGSFIGYQGDSVRFGLLSGGKAALTLYDSVPLGTYTVVTQYDGDAYNLPSTSNQATFTVGTTSTTSLSVTPSRVTPGTTVTLAATVKNGSNPVSSGNVQFVSGTTVIGTAAVNSSGVAQITYKDADLPAGTYTVTANYQGATTVLPSTSNTVQVVVGQ